MIARKFRKSSAPERRTFLSLPAEIRNKIYSQIVAGPWGLRNRHRRGQIAILATCRQIRQEASAPFHQKISIEARLSFPTARFFHFDVRRSRHSLLLHVPSINHTTTTYHTRCLTITTSNPGRDVGTPDYDNFIRLLRDAFPNLEEVTLVPHKVTQYPSPDQHWTQVMHFGADVFTALPTVQRLRILMRLCEVGDEDYGYYSMCDFCWATYAEVYGWEKEEESTVSNPFPAKDYLEDRPTGRLEMLSLRRGKSPWNTNMQFHWE